MEFSLKAGLLTRHVLPPFRYLSKIINTDYIRISGLCFSTSKHSLRLYQRDLEFLSKALRIPLSYQNDIFLNISDFLTGLFFIILFSVRVQPDDLFPDYTNRPQDKLFCAW